MKKNYTVRYRRKRTGRTDYNLRLRLLGAKLPRLVVRRSNNGYVVQVIQYEPKGDKVLAMATARDLVKLGWKGHKGNRTSGYFIGLICGKMAKSKGVEKCIFDIGRQRSIKGNSLYAVLKGFLEGGVEVPHKEDMLPSEDLIRKGFKDFDEIKGKIK